MTTHRPPVSPSDPVRADPARSDDWDQHWDAYSAAAEANPAQRYRRNLALKLLEQGGSPQRLLDLGSGQGDFLLAASLRWPQTQLLGIEPSDVGVRQSQEKVPSGRFEALDMTSRAELPEDLRGWATHAICSEVLEHVDDDVGLLAGARAVMAQGCRLVVTVPGGRMSAFDREIGHRRHYTSASLAAVVREAGLEVAWTAGAGFPFFNLYRALVIARGEKLAGDVAGAEGRGPTLAARAAMLAFRPLMRATLTRSPWGTQIVGVVRNPG
jgi:SAM-dependent methyltransferase